MTPKRICSPAKPSEPNKRQHNHHHRHNHQLRKSGTRGGVAGLASPLSWAKNKQIGSEISEPTSPKVTCAGQIKVRPKSSACKNWQSVMEEIERIRNNRNRKRRSNWVDSLGFKKEIMQFLTCLRSIRFDLSCFGNFPRTDITSDDDEEEVDKEYHESNVNVEETDGNSRTVFSKWYMVLQENQGNGPCREERKHRNNSSFEESAESVGASSVPPPNALLLMRCRSAPAKSWLEEKEGQEQGVDKETEEKENEEQEEEKMKEEKKSRDLKSLMEEEKINNKQNLVVMRYDTDFYKLSSDIAKETWVVGGMRDLLSRSRSWKR